MSAPVNIPESFAISLYECKTDNAPRTKTFAWPDLAAALMKHHRRPQKDGRLFSPALLADGSRRANENVLSLCCLVLDFDDGISTGPLVEKWNSRGLAYAVYSSHSSRLDYPKWRAVFPLSRPVVATDWTNVYGHLAADLGGSHVDPACKDASRMFYLPSCPPDASPFAFHANGEALDVDAIPPPKPPEPPKPARPAPVPVAAATDMLSDSDIIEMARRAKNGSKFESLWAGNAGAYGGDRSAALMGLAGELHFYTHSRQGGGDAQLEQLLLQSGFRDYEKLQRADYLSRYVISKTVAKLAGSETYAPTPRSTYASMLHNAVAAGPSTWSEISNHVDGEEDPAGAIAPLLELHRELARQIVLHDIRLTMKGVECGERADVGDITAAGLLVMQVRKVSEGLYRWWLCALYDQIPKTRYGARTKFVRDITGSKEEFEVLDRNIKEWYPVFRKVPVDVFDWTVPWYVYDHVAQMDKDERNEWISEVRQSERGITPELKRKALGKDSAIKQTVSIEDVLFDVPPDTCKTALSLRELAMRAGAREDKIVRILAKRAEEARHEASAPPIVPAEERTLFHTVEEEDAPPRRTLTASLDQEAFAGLELLARGAAMSVSDYLNMIGHSAHEVESDSDNGETWSEISDHVGDADSPAEPEELSPEITPRIAHEEPAPGRAIPVQLGGAAIAELPPKPPPPPDDYIRKLLSAGPLERDDLTHRMTRAGYSEIEQGAAMMRLQISQEVHFWATGGTVCYELRPPASPG